MSTTILDDRYELRTPLGSGGQAEVWLAFDRAEERRCAVKWYLASEPLALAARAETAAREALIAAERDLKKIEAWRDGILEAERAAQARMERIAADELAARMFQARR